MQHRDSQDTVKNECATQPPSKGGLSVCYVAGVKGSSEYFCRSANTQKGDSGGHSYLLQKFEEHTKGGVFQSGGSCQQRCSRWCCEVQRGNAGETLVNTFVKRLMGGCVCKYNEIYFPCIQSVKISISYACIQKNRSCHCRVVLRPRRNRTCGIVTNST